MKHKSIGLSYAMACPLACRHCITHSSPQAAGKMAQEQAGRYIPVAARFSSHLCFTGGEPLLYPEEICELTRLAADLGLYVSLVTGAGWAKQEPLVRRRLTGLSAAGLRQMIISWDVYHEEFSPRENALRLARAAVEAGLEVVVRMAQRADLDPAGYRRPFEDLPVRFEPAQLIRLGRASSLPASHFSRHDSPPQGPCPAVMSTLINYDGKVYACCGPSSFSAPHSPLVLGDAEQEPLAEILERAEQDPLLEAISLLGPYGLYTLLLKSGLGDACREKKSFTDICALCLDLTNEPRLMDAVREQLQTREAQALIVAARLWMKHRLAPELARHLGVPYGPADA